MNLLERTSIKAYYLYCNSVISREKCELPSSLGDRRNIFIYFDYEREFGNPDSQITDSQIIGLLEILNNYNIKSTWFSVGRIFHEYPDSIKEIVRNQHEIASHTYGHISPYSANRRVLKRDFELFYQASHPYAEVRGFHSPNGLWSKSLINYLRKYKYEYDVIGLRKNETADALKLRDKKGDVIIRFRTIGDDWEFFGRKYTESEIYNKLINKLTKIKRTGPAGIGFHPWILYSDPSIMEGFKRFLDTISSDENYNIKPAYSFVRALLGKEG